MHFIPEHFGVELFLFSHFFCFSHFFLCILLNKFIRRMNGSKKEKRKHDFLLSLAFMADKVFHCGFDVQAFKPATLYASRWAPCSPMKQCCSGFPMLTCLRIDLPVAHCRVSAPAPSTAHLRFPGPLPI